MRDDEVCAAVADDMQMPHRDKVRRKARVSLSQRTMEFVRDHGNEYSTRAEALEAFQQLYFDERKPASAAGPVGTTNVVGFPILTTVVCALISWLIQRWFNRMWPDKA